MKTIIDSNLLSWAQHIGWFDTLSRYETCLTNNLYRALRELNGLQSERKNRQ